MPETEEEIRRRVYRETTASIDKAVLRGCLTWILVPIALLLVFSMCMAVALA